MIFSNLVLNEKVWGMLSSSFKNNKIPNAFIFSGEDGVGKEAHAIEFSALLNCRRSADNQFACGDCRSCLKIKSFRHEEIHFIHPTPSPKNKSDMILNQKIIDELNKNYKLKSSNPYHKINVGDATTIPIASIRSLKKKLYYSKSDENWSVVLIFDSEKLCVPKAESANSLLKILEEPPERTLFLLLTSNINLLIPTIQSRCQKVYFKNLSASDLREYAIANLDANLTDEIIDISNGSLSKLLDNIDSNKSDDFIKIINYFYSDNIGSIEKILTSLNKIKTKNKNELGAYLDLIKISAKDLHLLNSNLENNSITFHFLRNNYESIIQSFPNANWAGIVESLDDCILNFSRNINISLETYALMINVRSCLQGKNVNRFHQQIDSEI